MIVLLLSAKYSNINWRGKELCTFLHLRKRDRNRTANWLVKVKFQICLEVSVKNIQMWALYRYKENFKI